MDGRPITLKRWLWVLVAAGRHGPCLMQDAQLSGTVGAGEECIAEVR